MEMRSRSPWRRGGKPAGAWLRSLMVAAMVGLVVWTPSALAAGSPPVNDQRPTLSGNARYGDTLTATKGTWTGTEPISYAYQWRSCDVDGSNCANITGATALTYVLTLAEIGRRVHIQVTATNAYGSAVIRSWNSNTVVSAPINTGRPALSGTARQGETMGATKGSWVGTEPIAYGYQWRRCDADGSNCVDIGGATLSTYTLTSLEVGRRVQIRVAGTNTYGGAVERSWNSAIVASPTGQLTCKISNRTSWSLGGSDCQYGTLIKLTNEQFRCSKLLSSYGPLPIKVVWTFTSAPDFGDQGYVDLVNGCRGDSDADTIDLIIDSNADGATFGARGGAGKFRTAGPRDIQVTGKFDCGPLGDSGAHQDVWQFHPSHPDANLAIVNGYSGNWNAGTSTCIGAGGAIFWSDQYDLDVYGGKYVTCNHGLFGAGQDLPGNVVNGASFRTGRVEPVSSGGDPACQGYYASDPCISTQALQLINVTCQKWDSKTNTWVNKAPK